MNVLTADDIEQFKRYLTEWQRRLGLQDWRIVFSPVEAKGQMAEMSKWDWVQRQVTCRLGHDWKATAVTPTALEQTAVHELLHVLLYELKQRAQEPGISDDDLRSVEHRVINTLEQLLVPSKE